MKFAEQLKKYRQARGMSQDDLAGKLFVSRQAVSKWENADGTPDLKMLIKLAEILNVSLDALVLGVEKETAAKVDADAYTYNPTTGLYTRRYGQMNFWDFASRFWWLLFPIGGFVIEIVNAVR